MQKIIKKIEKLNKSTIKENVDERIKEFKNVKESDVFNEMCFCILTANFNAEKCIRIQREIENGFSILPENELTEKLKDSGHRYPNTRARYIVYSRRYKESLKEALTSLRDEELRHWLVKNIKGLGYKEASHFLRNIGFDDFAIIDFHIIDLLVKYDLIERPDSLNKAKYLEIENVLKRIAKKSNLSLAELDLYLWYMETGKILK